MEKILALLTTNVSNNGGRNNNNDTTYKQPKIGKPNLRYKFYCCSRGINPTHNSCSCVNKKPGHQTAALYENQMGGYQTNKEKWCGFVTP